MKEQRRWPRVYFSAKDVVEGEVWIKEGQLIPVRVLNISEGGLALSLVSRSGLQWQKGDRFRLMAVKGKTMSLLTAPAVVEVMWVTQSEGFEQVGIGCSFLYLVPPDRHRILRFMEMI